MQFPALDFPASSFSNTWEKHYAIQCSDKQKGLRKCNPREYYSM